jgi:hypothetical protein
MLQRHPFSDRGHDLYETPPGATRALLKVENLPLHIWDPGCGRGAIVDELRAAGHVALGSDLVDYGRPDCFWRRDFLLETKMPAGCEAIVTNPPFKLAAEFVAHAITLCPYVAMLLRFAFFEAGTGPQRKHKLRRHVLDEVPPARLHVFKNRLPMMHRAGWAGPRANSQTAYAWFVWGPQPCRSHHAAPDQLGTLKGIRRASP